MRVTMIGHVSAKLCKVSMQVTFGAAESNTFCYPRPPGHLLLPPLPQQPCGINQRWNAYTWSYLDITSFTCKKDLDRSRMIDLERSRMIDLDRSRMI